MNASYQRPSQPLTLLAATAALLLGGAAQAQVHVDAGWGGGPDDYTSQELHADVDFADGRWNAGAGWFVGKVPGEDDTTQWSGALSWRAHDALTLEYRYSDVDDGNYSVSGHDLGVSIALESLWHGTRGVGLDIGYASLTTEANRGTFAGRTLGQTRPRLGLVWDITDTVSVNLAHEWNRYDHDPVEIAKALLRRSHNQAQPAFTLLGFADRSTSAGLDWAITDALTWRVSTGRTVTVLDQQLKYTRLGASYRWNKALTLGVSFTRNSSTAVVTPGGTVLQADSRGTWGDVTAGWQFD